MRIALAHAHVFRFARGIERYTVALAGALAGLGVDATIVTLQQPSVPPLRYAELDPRVRVHTLPNPRYYTAATTIPLYLADFLRDGGYDHILLSFGLNGEGLAARLAAALPGSRTRYSIVFHFPYEASPARFREFQRFGLLDHAAHRIAVSAYVAAAVRERLHASCAVIPEGVDAGRFCPDGRLRAATRHALGIAPPERVVVTVGALEPRKGMDRLLRAMASDDAARAVDRIVVVGDGPAAVELRALAAALGLAGRVIWIARSAELPALYNAGDLFALLSDHEAFGLAALEAMACGLPIVVSDSSAFPEFVAPGTGLLVDPADARAVGAALASLLADDARRAAMGAAARSHARASYGWERVARRFVDLLESPREGRTGHWREAAAANRGL